MGPGVIIDPEEIEFVIDLWRRYPGVNDYSNGEPSSPEIDPVGSISSREKR